MNTNQFIACAFANPSPREVSATLLRGFTMRKAFFALAAVFGVGSLFAEGTTPTIDTTTAANAVNQIATDLSSWVTTVLPYLLTIVGAFLTFWLVRLAIRLIQRFTNSAK